MVGPHQGTAIVVIIQCVWVMCMVALLLLLSVKSRASMGVIGSGGGGLCCGLGAT